MQFFRATSLHLISALTLGLSCATGAAAEPIERITVTIDGVEADGPSDDPVVSSTGRYVVFVSEATNLVDSDANGFADVFLKDRETGEIELISVASDGTQGNGDSGQLGGAGSRPRLSVTPDGRFVVFPSGADNLDPADTGDNTSLFLRDRENETTELLSFSADGAPSPAFATGVTSISDDGRFVVYHSSDSSFDQAGDVAFINAFLRDRDTGTTTLVNVNNDGEQAAPAGSGNSNNLARADISADGRYVVFDTSAPNLVDDDANDARDVFRRDTLEGRTIRVSVADDGSEADGDSMLGAMDATGRYVLFESEATNLADEGATGLFIRDIDAGTTSRLSLAPGDPLIEAPEHTVGFGQNLSSGARFVALESALDTLAQDDTNEAPDIFRYESATGELVLLSSGPGGGTGNDGSMDATISEDGRVIAFASDASDLVEDDTNEVRDIFATGDILRAAHPYEYAAKVVCGTQSDGDGLSLTPGRYATTVNIHSPSGTAEFSKKLALGIPPGGQGVGEIAFIAVHELAYDEVMSVDCDDLRTRLFPDGFPAMPGSDAAFIEGFLVLESEAPLDVTAVYTSAELGTADAVASQSSIDVERIPERRRNADVSVDKTVSTLKFPVTDNTELFLALFTITINNAGPDVAPGVALHDVMSLETSDALAFSLFALGDPALITLPPGASVTSITVPSATLSTLDIDIGDLDPGSSVVVEFWAWGLALVAVPGEPEVVLKDTVTVTSAGLDPAAANGTVSIETTLIP